MTLHFNLKITFDYFNILFKFMQQIISYIDYVNEVFLSQTVTINVKF